MIPGGMPSGLATVAFEDVNPKFAFIRWFDEAPENPLVPQSVLEESGCIRLVWAKRSNYPVVSSTAHAPYVDIINLDSIKRVVYIAPDMSDPSGKYFYLSRFKTTSVLS
jgi:hypothetical protein